MTGGDRDLVAYQRRALGYALTGSTNEHTLFFLHGLGANGKSVLLTTVSGVMGSYHRSAPIESFIATGTDRHPTDIAGLRGARFVTAVETEEGRHWAEARIKQLTGGDTVSARFIRGDFFDFRPAFKLFIAGNHKPSFRSVDEAIRRRFHLIPFVVTIPERERDPELSEKLKDEWPGILAVDDRRRAGVADGAATAAGRDLGGHRRIFGLRGLACCVAGRVLRPRQHMGVVGQAVRELEQMGGQRGRVCRKREETHATARGEGICSPPGRLLG